MRVKLQETNVLVHVILVRDEECLLVTDKGIQMKFTNKRIIVSGNGRQLPKCYFHDLVGIRNFNGLYEPFVLTPGQSLVSIGEVIDEIDDFDLVTEKFKNGEFEIETDEHVQVQSNFVILYFAFENTSDYVS